MTPADARRTRRAYFANFFFQFATLGVFLPFFGLFMKDKGFTGGQISLIIMTVPMMQMLANPLTGYLADTKIRRRTLYRIALVGVLVLSPGFYLAEGFWQFVPFVAVYGLFRLPKVSIINAAILERLVKIRADYGRLRLGGSVGFILFVLITGWWTDAFGVHRMPDVLLLGLVGHVLVGWRAPVNAIGGERRRPVPGSWRRFFKEPAWLLFLGGILFSRMAEGGYNIFYSVYLVDEGFAASFAGQMWALAVSSEVVFLLFSERIIRRFRLETILVFTYAVAAARWFLTAWAVEWWQFAALQLAHGITFGLFYVTAVAWAHREAPEGLETSAQGVTNAIMFGLSGVLGMLFAGPVYDWAGGAGVFRAAGALACISVVVALVRRGTSPPPEEATAHP